MGLPKKNKVSINNTPSGQDRVEEIVEMMNDKTTYLPKSILIEDLDMGMYSFVDEGDMSLVFNEKKVPVVFMSNERWADFAKTWVFSDEEKNVTMPSVTIERSEAPKAGSDANIKFRVAQNRKFTYIKVPTFDNGVVGVDYYKIPQPIPVDLTFEITVFTHFLLDLNKAAETFQRVFSNGQAYCVVKGHYIPMKLDSVADDSSFDDFEGQRFYKQTYTVLMMGRIQDEKTFEVIKGIRKYGINVRESED